MGRQIQRAVLCIAEIFPRTPGEMRPAPTIRGGSRRTGAGRIYKRGFIAAGIV